MHYDIIIVGSGVVGVTTALAIAQQTPLQIALVEANKNLPAWNPSSPYGHRVSAISLASKQIFESVRAWDAIRAKRLHAFTHMSVFDETEQAKIDFDCADVNESALGYIIEDTVLRASLLEQLPQQKNIHLLQPVQFTALKQQPENVQLTTTNNSTLTTKLLIAADGAHSWVREQLEISLKAKDYEQTALVATVQTELPHQSTAWQRFLSTGPIAFLPLNDPHSCSIVWSVTQQKAQTLLALNDAEFQQQLYAAFSHLGKIISTSARYHFPLHLRHAKNYVLDRIALVGDAAHTIHPLAGQGLNLGLLDASYLAETIATADAKNRDFSRFTTLRRYERWRKSDNFTMLTAVDFIKYLFANENTLLKAARNFGMNFANRHAVIKNFFIQYALGKRNDV